MKKNTWKFTKIPGKIMEISWNFVSPKKWEPWLRNIGKKIIAYCKTMAQKSDFTLLTNLLLNLLITD